MIFMATSIAKFGNTFFRFLRPEYQRPMVVSIQKLNSATNMVGGLPGHRVYLLPPARLKMPIEIVTVFSCLLVPVGSQLK